jgi:hypothetical protein
MKRFLVFFCLVLTATQAQETTIMDAVRYAQEDLNGTARFSAMSGAFGALGGDLSAIGVNPAGSAVFVNNQVGLSLSTFNRNNQSNYFNTKTGESDYSVAFNQVGGVYVLVNTNQESDWKKITMALNYDNLNNFDNTFFLAGTNPSQSVANYFLSFANNNNVALGDIESAPLSALDFAQWQTLYGYEGYIINPVDANPQNTQWVSNVPAGGNYYQEQYIVNTGYNGKLSFNFASQYQDWLYVGVILNSYFSDFRQSSSFYEKNSNDLTAGLQRMRFYNDLVTFGNGFSFSVGAIAKIKESARIGLAYESPKWLSLEDRFTQAISYVTVNNGVTNSNIFDPQAVLLYNYRLQTPARYTGSFAYVFGKSGLISIDYSMRDYSGLKFRPENYFLDLNQAMSVGLINTSELRVGGEKKIKQWSLRAGYRFEQSPYKNKAIMGDLNSFSGGIGYNFGDIRADISYTHSKRDQNMLLLSRGIDTGAQINTTNNNVAITILFEL